MNSGKVHRRISLSRKIFQYLLLTTLFSLMLLGFFWVESQVKEFNKEVKVLKENYSETKKLEVKNKILAIKDWIYWIRNHPPESIKKKFPGFTIEAYRNSESFKKLLQDYCLDSLIRIRFGKDEYVFINTMDGEALASNGKINLPPIEIFKTGDTAWIRIFRVEQKSEVAPGGIFYTYSFQKISVPKRVYKTSIFSYLPEWRWIIGTGFYEDDVNTVIELKKQELYAGLRKSLLSVIPVLLFTILFSFLIVLLFSKRLAGNIDIFIRFFRKAASENTLIDKTEFSYKEFKYMAEVANAMINDRIKAEEKIRAVTRTYLVLSSINQSIVRVREKQTLYNETCRIAVEEGGFFMAWIGLLDSQTKKVIPVAYSGFQGEYLNTLNIDLNDEKLRQGPTGRAIESGVYYIANDIANNPEMIPWRENALKLGCKSSAAFPIVVADKPIGAFMLYSKKQFFFDEIEIKLLDELVRDISFAIDFIETEILRKQAEKELAIHRENLEELIIQRTIELEKEKEHAQSADRIKSAFLATMSHELRTPLNSIIGFTGILMQERPGPLNIEQKKQLGMAQNSARHLLCIINDVLDISKIEAGQLKMNLQPFNLPDLINKVVETNKPFADKKNLKVTVSISPNINDIRSDNLRVQQILLNIVNNAIKFTESGTISIKCFLNDNFVKIQISDTGIGIELDKLELLFKPFMQVDTGLTRKHEGTGLGLSICKKLVEMLHGKVEVESEYGYGSTFTVSLPFIIP